jgi:hypothetical protein
MLGVRSFWGIHQRLSAFQRLKLIEGAGPVRAEEAREASIGKDLAPGLAAGAIVGLVVSVTNALHFLSAARTGLVVAAVYGKLRTEGSYLLRERLLGFVSKAVDPEREC